MPRLVPARPPTRGEVRTLPLHVLLRDWPELDPVLREVIPGLQRVAHKTLPEVLAEDAPGQDPLERLERATRWRVPLEP